MEYIFNEEPTSVKTQLEFIVLQLVVDGPTGIMVTMIENKTIIMADRIADCVTCEGYERTYNSNEGLAKGKVDGANKMIRKVKSHLRSIAQNGKLVLPSMSDLGNYGYNIIDGKKVKIPTKNNDLKILLEAIIAEIALITPPHCPLSPFIAQQNIDLAADLVNLGLAMDMKSDASQLREDNKGITHSIAVTMEQGEIDLRDFAGVITTVSPNDPALAALYGFKTRQTDSVEKSQKTKFLPSEFKSLENLSKLTPLVNETNQDLWVRKGKKRTGAYLILKANSTLLVTYGYGSCTVQNPSTTDSSELTSTVNRKVKAA